MNGIFHIKEFAKMMAALILVLLAMWSTGLSYANNSPQSLQQISGQINYDEVSVLGRGTANSIAWSPDGASLIVAGSLGIWRYDNDFQTVTKLVDTPQDVTLVVWSPDGNWIASLINRDQVQIWNATDGSLESTLQGDLTDTRSLKWNSDSNRLAVASRDQQMRIWERTTGQLALVAPETSGFVEDVSWNDDGTRLVGVSYDGKLYDWDLATNQVVTFEEINARFWLADWKSNFIAVAYGQDILLINSITHRIERTLPGNPEFLLRKLAWSPNGTQLASATDADITLWNSVTFQPEHVLRGHSDLIRDIKWNPLGGRLASTDFRDRTVYIWDTMTGELLVSLEGHTTGVSKVAWMPGDVNLATNYFDGAVLIWQTQLKNMTTRIPLDVAFVSWNNDWTRVAGLSISSEYPTVWNWTVLYEDSQTWTTPAELEAEPYLVMEYRPYLYDISSVTWNPNGQQVAVSSLDGRVYILDAATGSEIYVLEETEGSFAEAWQVTWSPDGSHLAVLIPSLGVRIWNTINGTADGTLNSVTEQIWQIAWSPDGKYLVGGTVQGDIILWNASTHALIFEMSGHTDRVNELAWHPRSNILASGSYDGTIILWDVSTGEVVVTLTGHNGPVTALAWNSDGTQLASGGEDGTIRIWVNQ